MVRRVVRLHPIVDMTNRWRYEMTLDGTYTGYWYRWPVL